MITPLKDFVLIKELKPDEVTSSGIIIPEETDQEPPMQGIIMKIGAEVSVLCEGQKVMFHRYGFDEIEYEKEKLLVGKAEHIFAIYD